MKGKLFLSSGGDEKQIFDLFFANVKKVLYIPLAWPNDDFQSCLEWFKKQTRSHTQLEIDMLSDAHNPVNLTNYNAVFIGGGNTFKLLKRLKESGLESKLIDFYHNGGKIYGGSAGTIIWGNNIETAQLCKDKDKNLVKLTDTSGFNELKNLDLQCHFETDQISEHQSYINKTGRNVIAIPDSSALVVHDNSYEVLGSLPITIITKDKVTKYQPSSFISL